mgnify:FL=1
MNPKLRKIILPTGTLLLLLSLLGLYLYLFTQNSVNWSAYIAMLLFYTLIFAVGAYASTLHTSDGAKSMMLAGRSMPLYLAIFTMSATWIGGGFINGTAEYTASSGLIWVQAPWGYALSLVVGGLFFAGKMRRFRFRTMLDPLEQRFGKKLTGLFFLAPLTGEIFWTAAILTALGTTFGAVMCLDTNAAIIIS